HAKAHALGREGEAFHGARVVEGLYLAVGETDMGRAPGGIGDGALRAGRDRGDPLALDAAEVRYAAVGGNGAHLAVLAAGDQALAGGVEHRAEQAVMDGPGLLAVVEAMDRATRHGEERDVADEGGGDAVAVEVERS